jgi:hypothetical protein
VGRITFASFPRTSSTYVIEALLQAYPGCREDGRWNMSHLGRHRIQPIRKDENVITIVRHPLDCCSSTIALEFVEDANGALDWYIRFMQATIARFDEIFVAKFEDVITDVNKVIANYAAKFNLDTPQTVDTNKLNKNEVAVDSTDAKVAVQNDSLYPLAVELYEKVISLINDNPNYRASWGG